MCSWFTLENITMYRGAALGFIGGSGALILAILEFRKPEARRTKWVAWLELFVAIAFFGQSVNDVWQVNSDAEERRKSEDKFATMSNDLTTAEAKIASQSNVLANAKMNSPKEQLLLLLDSIDKRIIAALRSGIMKFEAVGMKPWQYNELRRLSDEPENEGLIIVGDDAHFAYGGEGGGGVWVSITATPKLVEEAKKPEIKLNPRTINAEQGAYGEKLLGKFKGTPFVIESYADPDSTRFAEKVVDFLTANGWHLVGSMGGGRVTTPDPKGLPLERSLEPSGVVIEVNHLEHIEAAVFLDFFLSKCDIRSQYICDLHPKFVAGGEGVHVRVGTRD